jgi:glutathione synthase/RimK-type ligase-like ATP-grasp enzyme
MEVSPISGSTWKIPCVNYLPCAAETYGRYYITSDNALQVPDRKIRVLSFNGNAMSEIAFVTYQQAPEINDDDRLVANELRQRGVTVTAAIWDAVDIDWSRFDAVVIRSAWDYHLKAKQYAQWLERLSAAGVRVWNPPHAIRWNTNKRYLADLADRGVPVVPTSYQPAAKDVLLRGVLMRCGWDEVVIKPAISACAVGTWRTSLAAVDTDQEKFAGQLLRQDLLVQPYVPAITTRGEWSFIFFDGQYSHAALKRPANDDFRVQREFGGTSERADPAPSLVRQARSMVAVVEHELLYARVDAIEHEGQLMLMEMEINEPFLFLGLTTSAAPRFAEAILRKLPSEVQ